MSWSKHDESDQGPVIPLVSLEPDKNTKQQNNIDFSKHHHPGEKPGEDAQKMLNGIEDDNEKPFSDSIVNYLFIIYFIFIHYLLILYFYRIFKDQYQRKMKQD